ncbi:MAG: hypothetical protein L6U16_12705 [Porphyromonadaceae bacterium]|nr:MAG: hypothetical protein L6U16_12705 [Porphyromonadaceae bacterium]
MCYNQYEKAKRDDEKSNIRSSDGGTVLPAMALDLTWSKYNLNFSVPEGGFELLNTSVRYERQWEDMLLTVHLYTKDTDSKKDIYLTTLQRKAADFNMYEVKKTKIKVKNFDTYAVEGIMPDGTRGLLVNLVSKKSELVVQIVVNYLFGNREVVEEVVKSFCRKSRPQAQPRNTQTENPKARPKRPEAHKRPTQGTTAPRKRAPISRKAPQRRNLRRLIPTHSLALTQIAQISRIYYIYHTDSTD